MTTIITAALWLSSTKEIAVTGPPTRYDPWLMEQVAVTRGFITHPTDFQAWLDANGYAGAVAMRRRGDLYRDVWINGEKFFVLDCKQKRHFPGKSVVEVDWQTAQRWLAAGPWPNYVMVRFEEPFQGEIVPQ